MDSKIDYEVILKNIDQVIFQMEYDSMRSGGKVKINAEPLNAMYVAKARYEKMVNKPQSKNATDK